MFEAIENGVELVVIVTERIPRRDVAEMVELADLHGARIIGPNCLGIIVPDVIKMGGIGGPARDAAKSYSPGPVGVISRSGGMTTEMSSTLTAAGLGQSTAVSIGGDAIIGSTYAELMPLFEADEQTEAIVIYTEPGGRMEAQLAAWVTEHRSRLPIVAFMAGRFMDEMPGMSFGHAGTIVEGKRGHRDREDRPPRRGRHHRRRADRGHPRPRQAGHRRGQGSRRFEPSVHRRRGRARGRRPTPPAPPSSPRSARSTSTPPARTAKLRIVEENLDECVLCRLCIDAAPPGTVTVRKLYDGGAAL